MTSIEHAGRTTTGDLVAFDIRWEGGLAGSTVVWSMVVAEAGSEVRLCHERVDGRPTGQYVVDGGTGRRHDVELDADLHDDEITVRFPADVVGVAVEWPVWKAVVTVDGQDVAHHVVPVT
ncbi:MAG TPA: hypothetical protein VFG72_17950 [Marmoricola sp.]|nr:hypothetical protein [Marmoricola sp.]